MSSNPNFIVPIGTQVVCNVDVKNNAGEMLFAKGVVGIIVRSPVDNTHAYRVRFMDETELMLSRRDFIPRKQFQNPLEPVNTVDENDLYKRVIYRCITGSRAYGLDNDQSDTDLRGIFLPPADLHWSLYGVPEQLENDERQECYWEMQKFILLALKANPNILECLYTPLIEYQTPLASELLTMREIFVSKMIYQTYNGYVMSQFKRLEHHLQNHGTIKWKHAMHLIRLLLSGILALQERYIPVRVESHRDQLLAIRQGQLPWSEVNAWRIQLHKDFDAAFEGTKLPDRPDYERANTFLVHARRSAI